MISVEMVCQNVTRGMMYSIFMEWNGIESNGMESNDIILIVMISFYIWCMGGSIIIPQWGYVSLSIATRFATFRMTFAIFPSFSPSVATFDSLK